MNSTSSHISYILTLDEDDRADDFTSASSFSVSFSKTSGFPPLSQFPANFTTQFVCAFSDSVSLEWVIDYEKCRLVFENEYFARCECIGVAPTNLILQRGTIEYYQDYIPSVQTMHRFSARGPAGDARFIKIGFTSFDDNIYLAFREFAALTLPTSFIDFSWAAPGIWILIALLVIFLIFLVITSQKIYLASEEGNKITENYFSLLIVREDAVQRSPFTLLLCRHSTL